MKFNVFPNYRVPIDYIFTDEAGETFVEHVGWIETPDIEVLKKDHYGHLELVSR